MCGPLLLLALAVPAVELIVLIEVGRRIGGLETVFLVFGTAAVGLWLARAQGLAALRRIQTTGLPAEADVLTGPLLVLGAVLLLVPGLITDALGLLLLVPPLRRLVARRLVRRWAGGDAGRVIVIRNGRIVTLDRREQRPPPPDVIDVKVIRRDEDRPPDEDDRRDQ